MPKNFIHSTGVIFAGLFFVLTPFSAQAQDHQNEWTTIKMISSRTTLRYHWARIDGGFETVTLIEAIQNNKVEKSIHISGQPVFNQDTTRAAFPDCWDGGCSKKVRILDLSTLSELAPIQFEKESFLSVSWENEKRLKIERVALNSEEKSDSKIFEIN